LERLRSVKPVRSERLPAGRAVSQGELYAMMGMCVEDATAAGTRDAALIGMMYAAGLRRAEIVALDLADYTRESGELVVRGKGSKERLLYVDNGAQDALEDWLTVRGPEPGAIFCPINKGGTIQFRRLTDQAIYNMLRKRAGQATVKTCSPHDMRRTFVSDLLEAGADIATVQKLAGHAHIQTTARYDRRGEEAKKKAIGLLHVPWRKRE
ncbi:MAG: tyrosine-type recombinase/integrase, partial [Armatimonadota bacterium]